MSNIFGFGSSKKKDDKKDHEEFSVGGAQSGTAVYRPTNRGNDSDMMNDLIKHARGQQTSDDAADKNIGVITIYKNGFRLGTGEFRDRSDPKNEGFIKELMGGHVPRELEAEARKEWGDVSKVRVSLVDKSTEVFTPPPPKFDFKSSKGQTLGGSSSSTAGAVSFIGAQAQEFKLAASDSKTTVQLVLHPRQRVRVQFNEGTTVLQVYQHVMHLTGKSGFKLVGGPSYPPKPLTSPSLTLQQAGLLGSSIQQRL